MTKEKTKAAFVPISDRVAIKRDNGEEVTAGGIVLPGQNGNNRPYKGIVVAKGPGYRDKTGTLHPVDVEIGDEVYFSRMGFVEVNIKNETFLVIREGDIIGKVEYDIQ